MRHGRNWTPGAARLGPYTVLAARRYGHLYRIDGGGESWRKLWREFSEVSSNPWVLQPA